MHCAEKLYIVVVHHSGLDQHSSSMLSTVNARVDDHLWMGKPPRHMSTHPSLPSVAGWDEYLAKAVGVNRQIALYTSPYPCLAVCAFRCYTLLHNGTVLSVRHTASKVLPYNSVKQSFRCYTLLDKGTVLSVRHTTSKVLPYNSVKQSFRCYTLLDKGTVLSVRHTTSKVLPYNSVK